MDPFAAIESPEETWLLPAIADQIIQMLNDYEFQGAADRDTPISKIWLIRDNGYDPDDDDSFDWDNDDPDSIIYESSLKSDIQNNWGLYNLIDQYPDGSGIGNATINELAVLVQTAIRKKECDQ